MNLGARDLGKNGGIFGCSVLQSLFPCRLNHRQKFPKLIEIFFGKIEIALGLDGTGGKHRSIHVGQLAGGHLYREL